MPAENSRVNSLPIYEKNNLLKNPEFNDSEKLRRRKEAERLLEDPDFRYVQVNQTTLRDVPYLTTVSIGPMPTLGGWRIAQEGAITDVYNRALKTNPDFIDKVTQRDDVPESDSARAAVVEGWGLATEMALKWAIMRSAMKRAQEQRDFPHGLKDETIDSWVKASELGGGKSVAVSRREKGTKIKGEDRRALIKQHARHINFLNARKGEGKAHITAPDMGTDAVDMTSLRFFTDYVACMTDKYEGSGEPSPVTAKGVFHGINAMLDFMNKDGNETTFAIQGAAGEVGRRLFKDLRKKYPEATIVISDIDSKEEELKQLASDQNTKVVKGDEIFDHGGIFVPSGPSAQLNDEHLERMKQSGVIAVNGPANYLYPPGKDEEMAKKYHDAGILVAPAPLVNLGGILSVASEFVNNKAKKEREAGRDSQILTEQMVIESARIVGPMLKHVLERARAENKRPDEIFKEEALDEFASLCVEYGIIK